MPFAITAVKSVRGTCFGPIRIPGRLSANRFPFPNMRRLINGAIRPQNSKMPLYISSFASCVNSKSRALKKLQDKGRYLNITGSAKMEGYISMRRFRKMPVFLTTGGRNNQMTGRTTRAVGFFIAALTQINTNTKQVCVDHRYVSSNLWPVKIYALSIMICA